MHTVLVVLAFVVNPLITALGEGLFTFVFFDGGLFKGTLQLTYPI